MSGPVKGQCCQEQGRDLSVVDRWWRSGKDYPLRRSTLSSTALARTTPEKSPVWREVNVNKAWGWSGLEPASFSFSERRANIWQSLSLS